MAGPKLVNLAEGGAHEAPLRAGRLIGFRDQCKVPVGFGKRHYRLRDWGISPLV